MTSSTTPTTRPVVVSCPFCSAANRVDLARLSAGPKCAKCGKPLRLDRPQRVTDQDFERTVTGSTVPVLVDFYADWCGPCKVMAPAVDQLAHRHAGSVLVGKLDTDRAQNTARRFDIRGIPTVIVFREGREVARVSGAMPFAQLEQLLASARRVA
jgi:thioredoxin 2